MKYTTEIFPSTFFHLVKLLHSFGVCFFLECQPMVHKLIMQTHCNASKSCGTVSVIIGAGVIVQNLFLFISFVSIQHM